MINTSFQSTRKLYGGVNDQIVNDIEFILNNVYAHFKGVGAIKLEILRQKLFFYSNVTIWKQYI